MEFSDPVFAGIIIGIVAGTILFIVIVAWLWRRREVTLETQDRSYVRSYVNNRGLSPRRPAPLSPRQYVYRSPPRSPIRSPPRRLSPRPPLRRSPGRPRYSARR